jgi:hypothetical protein
MHGRPRDHLRGTCNPCVRQIRQMHVKVVRKYKSVGNLFGNFGSCGKGVGRRRRRRILSAVVARFNAHSERSHIKDTLIVFGGRTKTKPRAGAIPMTKNALAAMFPEGTMTLEEADPELYGIIKQEKRRQRYAWRRAGLIRILSHRRSFG